MTRIMPAAEDGTAENLPALTYYISAISSTACGKMRAIVAAAAIVAGGNAMGSRVVAESEECYVIQDSLETACRRSSSIGLALE